MIQLPKLGKVEAKIHREFKGEILFATISKTLSGKCFVSFNVECEHDVITQNSSALGIDLGIKDLLITSDGEKFDNNKLTYKHEQKLAKSIHDCGWRELTRQLQYKAEWNNKVYHKINRYFPSSQLCNYCGYKNEDTKNLGVRFWTCPECNTEHDRDNNAAINILNEGIRELKIAI